MLKSLWRSYKGFCREINIKRWFKPPSLLSMLLLFPVIIHAFVAFIPLMIWFIGTMLYFTIGCGICGVLLVRWLVRVVAYLVQLVIAKVRLVEPPSFPKPWEKRVRNMDGVGFEQYVADRLRARGYHDVQFTPATGDYGVDILATKHGKVYAFQCKCYTGSVGVSAVQEVFSGSRKYQADRAVVITNSRYTPNARTLAGDLGVSLWDLEVLDSIFCE